MNTKRFKEKAKIIMDEHGALHVEDVEQLLKNESFTMDQIKGFIIRKVKKHDSRTAGYSAKEDPFPDFMIESENYWILR